MAWPLPTKVRKSPLGYIYENRLVVIQRENDRNAHVEHASDGKHNAFEVPRAVASFSYAAGAYSIDAGSSPEITAVNKAAVGTIDITLDSAYFSLPMVARVACIDVSGESKPIIESYEFTSATNLRVYLNQLSTALGAAGNAWAAMDGAFCVAIHSRPYADTGSTIAPVPAILRAATFGPDEWNTLVDNQGVLRRNLLAEHTSAGLHNTRKVARGVHQAAWDGASYGVVYDYNAPGVSRLSAGIVRVTIDDLFTSPMQVFKQVDYPRLAGGLPTDLYVGNTPKTQFDFVSPKNLDLYLYKYDPSANSWSRDDTDFSLHLHTAAS